MKATGGQGFWAVLRFTRNDNTAHTASVDYVKITIDYSTSGAPYTLACAAGSFALSGVSTGLTAARKLPTSVSTFELSGNTTGLTVARKLPTTTAAFELSGQPAGIKAGRKLAAITGAFSLVGNAVNLTLQGAAQHLVLTASSAVFNLTGATASLRAGRRLPISAGSYALTGAAAELKAVRRMVAGVGAFVLTGASVNLTKLVARANPTKRLIVSGRCATIQTSVLPVIDSRENVTPKRDNYVSTD